jgi:hypothetical protein
MTGDFSGVTLTPALGVAPNQDIVKFDSIGIPYRRDGSQITGGGNTVVIAGGAVIRTITVEPVTGQVSVN